MDAVQEKSAYRFHIFYTYTYQINNLKNMEVVFQSIVSGYSALVVAFWICHSFGVSMFLLIPFLSEIGKMKDKYDVFREKT